MRYFFQMIGINLTEKEFPFMKSGRLWMIRILFLYAFIQMFIYSVVNRDNLKNFLFSITYTFNMLTTILMFHSFYHYREDIQFTLQCIDDNVFVYSDEEDIQVVYEWYLQDENAVGVYLRVCLWQSIPFAIVGMVTVLDFIFGRENSFLFYPAWTPWSMNNFFAYLVSYLLQAISCIVILWNYYLVQAYAATVILELLRQHVRLRKALVTLAERTRKHVLMTTVNNSNVEMQENLEYLLNPKSQIYSKSVEIRMKQCFRHHILLQK